jgi:hypothetical protein
LRQLRSEVQKTAQPKQNNSQNTPKHPPAQP